MMGSYLDYLRRKGRDSCRYTAGPWRVEPEQEGSIKFISAPNWGALASVHVAIDEHGDGKEFTPSEEGEANADLIAAAPAYEKVWAFVPSHIKKSILDSFNQHGEKWVEYLIGRVECPVVKNGNTS